MKIFFLLFFLIIMVFACSRKSISTATTPAVATDTLAVATTKPVIDTAMLTKGKAIYQYRCGRCHALKPVGKYTAEEWPSILQVMVAKAGMHDSDAVLVKAYVLANAKK